MLGVVGERFPKGGALAMGAMGGIGMLSAGLLGGPGIGYTQDVNATAKLRELNPAVLRAGEVGRSRTTSCSSRPSPDSTARRSPSCRKTARPPTEVKAGHRLRRSDGAQGHGRHSGHDGRRLLDSASSTSARSAATSWSRSAPAARKSKRAIARRPKKRSTSTRAPIRRDEKAGVAGERPSELSTRRFCRDLFVSGNRLCRLFHLRRRAVPAMLASARFLVHLCVQG